ncbi:NUDIX hydrolase [Micromonospora parva]|uniref:NUDIX hydrolase n=1 Tax=Micromonospora parva TaxID=1464048 RepID=UPI003404B7C5
MTTADEVRPVVAWRLPDLRDLVNSTGLGGLVAGDGTWLTLGEVIARFRAAGFSDSESTIRREVDDLVAAGTLDSYLTRGRHRRVSAAGIATHLLSRTGSPERGLHVPEEATKPERSPVVASIVTSALGVLIGRRNDGKPPWTFIAGEIEPGESAADAAVREVKEETGLLVTAAEREIGRRVHPKTGRTMVYLACRPTSDKLDVFVGDEDELAEVKWASLDEVQQLLPGLFEPVLAHLQRELRS